MKENSRYSKPIEIITPTQKTNKHSKFESKFRKRQKSESQSKHYYSIRLLQHGNNRTINFITFKIILIGFIVIMIYDILIYFTQQKKLSY